jgi:hypothetical protein
VAPEAPPRDVSELPEAKDPPPSPPGH